MEEGVYVMKDGRGLEGRKRTGQCTVVKEKYGFQCEQLI